MNYKISIIVPIYNVEDYLSDTLDSIISQSIGIENLEVILVDDKSSDGSADIIKHYVEKFDNFKGIFLEKGSGFPGKPRNVGLEFATSDFIMFLDSDDLLVQNACEVLYDMILKEDADIVCGSYTKKNKLGVDEFNYGIWVSTLTDLSENYSTRLNKTKELLSDPNFKLTVTNLEDNGTVLGNANVWGKIFRADLIKENNILFPEDIVAQDSVFLLESFYCADKIVFIKDVIVHYNNMRDDVDDKSISYVKSNKNLFGRIKAYGLMHNLSKRFGYEKLFYRYLLGHKLKYWFGSHLLETYVSTSEIESIFKDNYELFNQAYLNNEMLPKKAKKIFKEVADKDFHIAAKNVSKLQKHHFKKNFDIDVSVIISIDGMVKYPFKSLEHVMNQSLKNIEIICIDEEYSEETSKLLNIYKSNDNRIKVISKSDSNTINLKNNAINIAQGEFILFLEHNAWLEDNALEKLIQNAISNDSELVLFDVMEHKDNNVLKNRVSVPFDSSEDYDNFTFNHLFISDYVFNLNYCGTKFYRTSFLLNNDIYFNDFSYFDDILFHIKSLMFAKQISFCPDFLYNYSWNNQSPIKNEIVSTEKSFIIFEILDEVNGFIKENGFYDSYQHNFLNFKISHLKYRLNEVANHRKEKLYSLIRTEFNNIDVSSDNLKELSFDNYKFYINVLTFDSFFEFIYYQDVEFNNDNIEYSNILNSQNELIVDLDNKISLLTEDNLILNKFLNDILQNNFISDAIHRIQELNLFDETFYRSTYNYDGDLNPLIHYIYKGYKYGWNPCNEFDASFYTSLNSNLQKSKMNPLLYFVMNGLDEGIIRINDGVKALRAINKKEVDVEFNNFNNLGVKTIKRKQKVIISLTSFPHNIDNVHYCIFSLLNQKFLPDEVILWLAEDQFPNKYGDLSKELLKLLNNGLTINWCTNIKSYQKLIPSLNNYSDDIIITVDDNIYYPDFWLSNLMDEYYRNPNCILCYQSKKISFDENRKINNYGDWKLCRDEHHPSYLNFGIGAAGILYPPNSLNKNVSDENLFVKLCPYSEDLWFWAMAVLNHTKIKVIGDKMNNLVYVDPSRELHLFDGNEDNPKKQIDNQIKKVLNYYPDIMSIIVNENK
jgi:glycosyltransferase involved in cell wall biosynthesis